MWRYPTNNVRVPSRRIFSIFLEEVGEQHVERASIDEAFLDVTHMVPAALDALPIKQTEGEAGVAGVKEYAIADDWRVFGGFDPNVFDPDRYVPVSLACSLRTCSN